MVYKQAWSIQNYRYVWDVSPGQPDNSSFLASKGGDDLVFVFLAWMTPHRRAPRRQPPPLVIVSDASHQAWAPPYYTSPRTPLTPRSRIDRDHRRRCISATAAALPTMPTSTQPIKPPRRPLWNPKPILQPVGCLRNHFLSQIWTEMGRPSPGSYGSPHWAMILLSLRPQCTGMWTRPLELP
jgi:hypothetical protein